MDEARDVIRRLERIEALQGTRAPADELLAEVRQLLAEGEAWLAAERVGDREHRRNGLADARANATAGAAAALEGCRATLAANEEVMPETAESAHL
ncbi:MAG: hypothetical protein ACRDMY_09060 [Gaiellaceae bacterium]